MVRGAPCLGEGNSEKQVNTLLFPGSRYVHIEEKRTEGAGISALR